MSKPEENAILRHYAGVCAENIAIIEEQNNALCEHNNALLKKNNALRKQNNSMRKKNNALRKQNNSLREHNFVNQGMLNAQLKQNNALREQNNAQNKLIDNLVRVKNRIRKKLKVLNERIAIIEEQERLCDACNGNAPRNDTDPLYSDIHFDNGGNYNG
jgi:predicted nuclease with TOPRIM domain